MGFVRNNRRIFITAALLQVVFYQALKLHPDWGSPWYRYAIYFVLERAEYPWILLANMMFAAGANYYLCQLVFFVLGSTTFFAVMFCCRRK